MVQIVVSQRNESRTTEDHYLRGAASLEKTGVISAMARIGGDLNPIDDGEEEEKRGTTTRGAEEDGNATRRAEEIRLD